MCIPLAYANAKLLGLPFKPCQNWLFYLAFLCVVQRWVFWLKISLYEHFLNLTSIKGLHTKLLAYKVIGVLTLGISRLPFGSLRTKWHLGVGLVARHKEFYKGEGGGFPQVRAMMNLVSLCLPMARPCIKSASTMH